MNNTTIGNLLELQRGYDLTHNEMNDGPISVVGSNGVIGYHDVANVKKPCLVIGRSGTVGIPHIYEEDCWAHNTTLFVKDFKGNDPYYLYYLLKNLDINKVASSTGVPTLNRNFVHPLKIKAALDFNEQKKISNVLRTLDFKIDSNNHINSELESMAKTLYDYWFLQFEFPNKEGKPYKSSGGKMVYNEELKREIPEGWEVKQLKDFITLGNDNPFEGDDTNTIDLSVMPSSSISLNELNSSSNFDTNLFEMKKGDILFGSIRPYLKKAGIAPCDGAVAGTVHCFRTEDKYYNYALLTICSENMFDYAIKNSQGTKMPIVKAERILEYPVPYNDAIVKKYCNMLNIKNIICNNIMENQQLAELRDFLLPMLMNGQVTFKEIE